MEPMYGTRKQNRYTLDSDNLRGAKCPKCGKPLTTENKNRYEQYLAEVFEWSSPIHSCSVRGLLERNYSVKQPRTKDPPYSKEPPAKRQRCKVGPMGPYVIYRQPLLHRSIREKIALGKDSAGYRDGQATLVVSKGTPTTPRSSLSRETAFVAHTIRRTPGCASSKRMPTTPCLLPRNY